MSVFHEGELAVQSRVGVQRMAQRLGKGIYPYLPSGAEDFLASQSMAVIASMDEGGRVWASLAIGEVGFLSPDGDSGLRVQMTRAEGDPLSDHLIPDAPLGVLVIDLATRQRVRLNGRLRNATDNALHLDITQFYGNCPKYIQARRVIEADSTTASPAAWQRGATLTAEQQAWIANADTFFIASLHPTGGADASHRGGQTGFVRVMGAHRLTFPDYAGNMMFNTLGNLASNPAAGLLFVDFESGKTLHLTGRATIVWDSERIAEFVGAERLVDFEVEQVIEITPSHPLHFSSPKFPPHNPR